MASAHDTDAGLFLKQRIIHLLRRVRVRARVRVRVRVRVRLRVRLT